MPTRSIQVKLIVPRGERDRKLRQALFATHRAVNSATEFYENQLLLMRGQAYVTEDAEVSVGTVLDELKQLIRTAVSSNGGEIGERHLDVSVDLLRRLYERIVPSAIGEDGSAQAANAFIGPLTDPDSIGFSGVFEKLDRPIPNWVSLVEAEDPSAQSVANSWFNSPNSKTWLKDTGSPATWVRLARKDDPAWPLKFVEKLSSLKEEASKGVPSIVKQLRDFRVLPLFPPYLAPRIEGARGTLCPWDRLALRLAVGHMLSWESWCIKSAEEHQARIKRVQSFSVLIEPMSEKLAALRVFETEHQEQLGTRGLGEAQFHILPRQLRGWADLKDKWQRSKDKTESALINIIASEQARLLGKFGYPDLFRWLAKTNNNGLWEGDTDPVNTIATLNAMQGLVDRSRVTAHMTLPDLARHPRYTQWEPPGGSNLRHYSPAVDAVGNMSVNLEILEPLLEGRFKEAAHTFRIAPSGQLRAVELERVGKELKIGYQSNGGETYSGKLQSSDLLFKRSHFESLPRERLESGDIGPTYLKFVIDVDKVLPDGWSDKWPPAAAHFKTALGKKTKHEDKIKAGVRVLSIDLGVRTFASCSVFELKEIDQGGSFSFPLKVNGRALQAVHERSFRLPLPDEITDKRVRAWRDERDEDLRRMRKVLARYHKVMSMFGEEILSREVLVSDLEDALNDDAFPFELGVVAPLINEAASPQPAWDQAVEGCLKAYRKDFGSLVKVWRSNNRRRENERHMGKSMWAIDYLTNTRRFLQSWSLLGRSSGDVRRMDRDNRGVFAANLLDHINHIKADRLKTGSDLIVQAARGYLRNGDGKWEHRFKPCEIILFEDLSRYRMRTDRPKRENLQLMKWAHRSIPREVKMQGDLYGLNVEDTPAAFSSRYHAKLNTPGVRCRVLKKTDLDDGFIREKLARDGTNLDDLQPGDWVLWQSGEMFACIDAAGKLFRIHADINAAQNLQRRFWTRFAEPFRIPCNLVRENDQELWVPRNLGKRLIGSMGGAGILVPTGHPTESCRWEPVTGPRYRRLGGGAAEDTTTGDPDMEQLDAMAEAAIERSGDYATFFRDPSGNVLPSTFWFPSKVFWSIVNSKINKVLKNNLGQKELSL